MSPACNAMMSSDVPSSRLLYCCYSAGCGPTSVPIGRTKKPQTSHDPALIRANNGIAKQYSGMRWNQLRAFKRRHSLVLVFSYLYFTEFSDRNGSGFVKTLVVTFWCLNIKAKRTKENKTTNQQKKTITFRRERLHKNSTTDKPKVSLLCYQLLIINYVPHSIILSGYWIKANCCPFENC